MFEAVAFRIANEIEPMTRPTFAVLRGREQPVDKLLVSLGRTILHECIDGLRSGRKPDEIHSDAAD